MRLSGLLAVLGRAIEAAESPRASSGQAEGRGFPRGSSQRRTTSLERRIVAILRRCDTLSENALVGYGGRRTQAVNRHRVLVSDRSSEPFRKLVQKARRRFPS